jgi:hypothetical protein
MLSLATAAAASASAPQAPAAGRPGLGDPVRYDRDIRPILADRCFKCHGPDPKSREAELRLDERAGAIEDHDGTQAVVPGNPDDSELWRRITAADPAERMPPADSSKKPLTEAERDLLRRWIEQGAAYEPHWSFVPPRRPAVPAVHDAQWCRTDVDRFLLANLERHGVTPGREAGRATLARRAFLLLTGLPPTPAELDAFAADPDRDAYERLVQRLLHEEPYSSRHAEHLATPWLDAARYADTCGIHMDAGRQIWPWRDWVLRACRDGMPFDRFLTEQIAGDLLPGATQDQQIASGLHRNHVTTDEGGAIDEEYRVEYAVDRTATTGAVFLGLTLGCARCHEHKFDPISHEDFYRLYAYFNSNDEPGLYSQVPDANRALEPFLEVPTPAQQERRERLRVDLAAAKQALDEVDPAEAAAMQSFLDALGSETGVAWAEATVTAACSTEPEGATLAVQPDGSVLASGPNPPRDVHAITLRTEAANLRLLCLEALPDASLPAQKVGRAPNGNAVLNALLVEAVSVRDPQQRAAVPLAWAWADVEQQDGDFGVANVLDAEDGVGWAVAAHQHPPGPRTALLLAKAPFGFAGGTDVTVTLRYDSGYDQHALGRVRLRLGTIGAAGLERLPEAQGGFHTAGPFAVDATTSGYAEAFPPEATNAFDRRQRFGDQKRWRHAQGVAEGRVGKLADGRNVSYVAWQLFAPTARARTLALGSDDGFVLFHDGVEVARREVDRGAAPDQDRAEVQLREGSNLVLHKVVNTGGEGGFALRRESRPNELAGDLVVALLPESARTAALAERLRQAWRLSFSPGFKDRRTRVASLEKDLADLEAKLPRTMVMKELATPRDTYVLMRGAYDQPDKTKKVERGIPPALGALPEDAPPDRRGLAQWLCAADNPLVARVQMNRLWELLFGTGIVRTSEDFGMQGEWPSHPELLDWLAVEFRESGWDRKKMLFLLATSAVFRQEARARPDVRERDPDNRWLSWFPRRRLSAEVIRDQALYLGGLLVEQFGGPSVKPYQPEGLWQEVAMQQSNTRVFQRGNGDDLWRRSLYTYWKRACPPPNLMTFDAPTREFCTIRRSSTNTPLQALVLWNDEQFVEAARGFAERMLQEPGDDQARLALMFRAATARTADGNALQRLAGALRVFRQRYTADPGAAAQLLEVGERPVPGALPGPELAAWTMVASAMLNLDATICAD